MAAPKEGGFKMSLGKLKVKPGLKNPLLQKEAKKPRLALGDDEPEDTNKQREILGWDAAEGGALEVGAKKEEDALRIIPVQPNRDWRTEARRKILANAPHQQERDQKSITEATEAKEKEATQIQYGLTIMQKEEPQQSETVEASELMDVELAKDALTEEQRLEKKAMDALLTGKSTDEDLVIPVQTEEEAFYDDLSNAPEAPTLEAYEAQPIEGFGAALLRGMGWKDGEAFGKNAKITKQKEVKRRPALLGIGAKEEAAVGIELGAWGPKNSKGKKAEQGYNPVALRNKRTGEIITEDELKAKLASQDLVADEKPAKSRSKYNDGEGNDERKQEKRRDRKDDRDRDRRREDDYDSERRRDKDSRSDRRREKDDYNDSDRRRDKRRDRDDEYDSERRKDRRRARSRSPGERSEKRRDRYRSRSRDTEDKKERRKDRDHQERSRSRDSEDRRKRRREREYDDDREDRKRRYRDEKHYK